MEKGKDVKLQGVTCTKLSGFLNVNVYKQLGQGEEKERGMGVIEDEKGGEQRRNEGEKSWDSVRKKRRNWEGERGRRRIVSEGRKWVCKEEGNRTVGIKMTDERFLFLGSWKKNKRIRESMAAATEPMPAFNLQHSL